MLKGKEKNAVVFGLTSNHIFAVASVMMDLKKYSPIIVDEIVVFLDKEIPEHDKNVLNTIFPTKFIIYDFPIKNTAIFNKGTFNYFSKMVFSKYECLRLLNDYKSVLWLDYDIVITKDISELFAYCDSGIKMILSYGCPIRNQLHDPVNDYDMNADAICASTFIFQDHLSNFMELYRFCYEKLEVYAKYLNYGEQAIFDFMIQEFKLKIEIIDKNKYSPHPTDLENINNAKILHAFGQPKFWNGIENHQWNSNYEEWVRLGGSKKDENKIINRIISLIKRIAKNIFISN